MHADGESAVAVRRAGRFRSSYLVAVRTTRGQLRHRPVDDRRSATLLESDKEFAANTLAGAAEKPDELVEIIVAEVGRKLIDSGK